MAAHSSPDSSAGPLDVAVIPTGSNWQLWGLRVIGESAVVTPHSIDILLYVGGNNCHLARGLVKLQLSVPVARSAAPTRTSTYICWVSDTSSYSSWFLLS